MKKPLKTLLKITKWAAIAVFGFYFIAISIFGFRSSLSPNGTCDFYWSGLEGLWEENEDFGFWKNKKMSAKFSGIDGPYIIGEKIYRVNEEQELRVQNLQKTDSVLITVDNRSNDKFFISLDTAKSIETGEYEMPERLLAISDIEGNFNAFSSFLMKHQVIDTNFNWSFGNGHVVLPGDFIDRGEHVTQVLWLIYHIETQAAQAGGRVHFILGNHEIMNFQGDWRYNRRKYVKASLEISGEQDWDKAVKFMYSNETELGKWLRTKNVIIKIGPYIFVHAGLHPEILTYNLSIQKINSISRKNWDKNLYSQPGNDKTANFLTGRKGPYWYRGMAMDYKYYDKITETGIDSLLNYYHAEKIVIGHTVMKDISTDFHGKIIKIDVKHGKEKNSSSTRGLLIENKTEYILDGAGTKKRF